MKKESLSRLIEQSLFPPIENAGSCNVRDMHHYTATIENCMLASSDILGRIRKLSSGYTYDNGGK